MNNQLSRSPFGSSPRLNHRAQLSPLSPSLRATSLARLQGRPSVSSARDQTRLAIPASDSLTPATPSLVERWWNPHLIDRLKTPLTRIRE